MKRGGAPVFIRDEGGSSLLATLIMITVMSILVGSIAAAYHVQYRFIRRDGHRLQARYAAEAGVYIAMDSLEQNPLWQAQDVVLDLPEEQTSRVTLEAFGGYLYIQSQSQYRRSRSTVRALVGEAPPSAFDNAVHLGKGRSGLSVAGTTRITGSMVVGERGVKAKTFKRQRFTGHLRGAVLNVPDLRLPSFDEQFLEAAVEAAEAYLVGAGEPLLASGEAVPLAMRLPSTNPVYFVSGNLGLTEADSTFLRQPVTVVASRDLFLEGPIRFQPGTIFVAGRMLHVGGGVSGREGFFYGREGMAIKDATQLSGQFFSRTQIRILGSSYLSYPSLLYTTGESVVAGGAIALEDSVVVNGTLIQPPMRPEPQVRRGRILVGPAAQVRGSIFNAHETEFHGTLYGALVTGEFYFYESPTSYINWLKDVVIDAGERPVDYTLPRGFNATPRLVVMNWEAFTEDVPRQHPGTPAL